MDLDEFKNRSNSLEEINKNLERERDVLKRARQNLRIENHFQKIDFFISPKHSFG